jgi:hypothetical protein
MAADASTLANLIVELYRGPWVEALFTNTFLLTRIQRKTGVGDGIRWPVRYAGNASAGSYAEGDGSVGSGNQGFKKAFLAWRLNKVEVEVSGLVQAIGDAGGMIVPALRTELDLGLADVRANINSQLMSDGTGPGSDGTDITGLLAAIADTGIYAGIDRGTYTWWKAYVNDNGGTPRNLSEALIRDVKSTIEGRGGRVTAIYAGSTQWYKYGDLLRSERRQQTPGQLTGGYQTLDFEGAPMIKVPGYPAARVDFLDEEQLEYVVLTDFAAKPMAKVKDSDVIWITHYSQLVYRNPYRAGSLQDLA